MRGIGTVATFEDSPGYGTVADDDGNEWFFHCTAIADGTRTIEVGTAVVFDVTAGRLGRWEAANIEELPR